MHIIISLLSFEDRIHCFSFLLWFNKFLTTVFKEIYIYAIIYTFSFQLEISFMTCLYQKWTSEAQPVSEMDFKIRSHNRSGLCKHSSNQKWTYKAQLIAEVDFRSELTSEVAQVQMDY